MNRSVMRCPVCQVPMIVADVDTFDNSDVGGSPTYLHSMECLTCIELIAVTVELPYKIDTDDKGNQV